MEMSYVHQVLKCKAVCGKVQNDPKSYESSRTCLVMFLENFEFNSNLMNLSAGNFKDD